MFVFWDSLGCVIFQDLNIWVSDDSSCKHWVISYSKKRSKPRTERSLLSLWYGISWSTLSQSLSCVYWSLHKHTERERHAHKFFNQASLSCCMVPRKHDWARGMSYDFCSQNDYFPLQIGKVIPHPHSVYHNKTWKKIQNTVTAYPNQIISTSLLSTVLRVITAQRKKNLRGFSSFRQCPWIRQFSIVCLAYSFLECKRMFMIW